MVRFEDKIRKKVLTGSRQLLHAVVTPLILSPVFCIVNLLLAV